jgi:MYXO-CTERM domain-containing protein
LAADDGSKSTQNGVPREIRNGTRHAPFEDQMLRRSTFWVALASGAVAVGFAGPALAQAAASVSPSLQQFPERFVNGKDVGQSERSQNLTPLGINFNDCNRDMVLEFRALVTLPPGDSVQVWATNSSDCSQNTARGVGGVGATCWRLNAGLGALVLTNQVENFDVRVQDIIGGQQAVGTSASTPVSAGSSACQIQGSIAATQFHVFIMAMQSDSITVDGTFWNYALPVDVVGPPPPRFNQPKPADTIAVLGWTPNTDSDTGGYDVFVDPPPGSVAADGAVPSAGDATTLSSSQMVCPEAGPSAAVDAASASDASDDASDGAAVLDATTGAATSDASSACFFVTTTPTNGTSTCPGMVFPGASSTQDAAAATASSTTLADGAVEDSGVTETGSGGSTNIDCAFLVGASCPAGQKAFTATRTSVTGESSGSFTVTGLVNGVNYNFTVAAVDNFGNIGPLAPQTCQVPAPVNDFFDLYRTEGGGGGGGLCSVDVVGGPAGGGAAVGAIGVALMGLRRRRRRA